MRFKGVITDINTVVNNLKTPVGNLGLTRVAMPQIESVDRLRKGLRSLEIDFFESKIPVSKLRLAQNEINKFKILKLMRIIRREGIGKMDPIVVSRDNYVIDGSHRFVAKLNQSKRAKIPALKVDMDALELVEFLNQNRTTFGTKNRNYSDSDI